MITQLLQKHLEGQEHRRKDVWHGIDKRPTMYIASMDVKTAFDVGRLKHIAIFTVDKTPIGELQQFLPREMEILEGHTTFDNVDSKSRLTRCIRQGSVEKKKKRVPSRRQLE